MSAPKGPRVLPVELTDEQGAYLVFPGRVCTAEGCGVPLTSRNRAGPRLNCWDCERARDRDRKKGAPRKSRAGQVSTDRTRVSRDPARAAVQLALADWLDRCASTSARVALNAALDSYELRGRLQRLIPAAPLQPSTPQPHPESTYGYPKE